MGGLKIGLVLTALAVSAVLCFGGIRLYTSPALAQSISPLSLRQSRDYPGVRYVGSEVCARCHKAEAESRLATPMAHALEPAAACGILAQGRRLTFANGPYVYSLTGAGGHSAYTVTDGKRTITEPVLYCFGQGEVGQTYVFQHDGQLYESLVSYFHGIQGLDFTVGHTHVAPSSLDDALGRPIGREEARDCFGCHAPEAVKGDTLRLEGFSPRRHVRIMPRPRREARCGGRAEGLARRADFQPRRVERARTVAGVLWLLPRRLRQGDADAWAGRG